MAKSYKQKEQKARELREEGREMALERQGNPYVVCVSSNAFCC